MNNNNNNKLKCAYCGQEKDKSEMIQSEIIFQDRNEYTGKKFVNSELNWYCKDKPCAGYDQMAHQG